MPDAAGQVPVERRGAAGVRENRDHDGRSEREAEDHREVLPAEVRPEQLPARVPPPEVQDENYKGLQPAEPLRDSELHAAAERPDPGDPLDSGVLEGQAVQGLPGGKAPGSAHKVIFVLKI